MTLLFSISSHRSPLCFLVPPKRRRADLEARYQIDKLDPTTTTPLPSSGPAPPLTVDVNSEIDLALRRFQEDLKKNRDQMASMLQSFGVGAVAPVPNATSFATPPGPRGLAPVAASPPPGGAAGGAALAPRPPAAAPMLPAYGAVGAAAARPSASGGFSPAMPQMPAMLPANEADFNDAPTEEGGLMRGDGC